MPPLPLLFVDHAPARGGAENWLLLLFEHLDRARFVPHLASPPGDLANAARAVGAVVHEVPFGRLRSAPAAPWRFTRVVAALCCIVRRERIALVHANSVRASLYAAAVAKLTRRPLVWHVHEILRAAMYARVMCALADAAIAVSAAAATCVPCAGKVRIIHNGVRLADFQADRTDDAARLRAAWGVPRDATVIGQVARLQKWKGQPDVIAIAQSMVQRFAQLYFLIVGGDIFGDARAYEQELKADVRRRGLSDRVIFTGHQSDIIATLQALDILVHPSANEPFGRILIEAGAAAIPVVAYASGGVAEAIVHEQTGLLVQPGDRVGLATALDRLLTDRNLARALGDAARKRVQAQFDVRPLTREVEEVFHRLVRDADAAQPGE